MTASLVCDISARCCVDHEALSSKCMCLDICRRSSALRALLDDEEGAPSTSACPGAAAADLKAAAATARGAHLWELGLAACHPHPRVRSFVATIAALGPEGTSPNLYSHFLCSSYEHCWCLHAFLAPVMARLQERGGWGSQSLKCGSSVPPAYCCFLPKA